MFYKKFALSVLALIILLGWSKPVTANANEEVSSAVITQTADAQDTSQETVQTASPSPDAAEAIADAGSTTANRTTETVSKKKTTKKKTTKKKSAKYTKSQLRLMASIINCEAGGESMQGKIAVGIVVMNRVQSKSFPNTIRKVIYQKGQFSPVRNGSMRRKLKQYDAGKTGSTQWKSCISAAKKVLKGQKTVVVKGKVKNMKGYHFFSVYLRHAKFKLGGHRFK